VIAIALAGLVAACGSNDDDARTESTERQEDESSETRAPKGDPRGEESDETASPVDETDGEADTGATGTDVPADQPPLVVDGILVYDYEITVINLTQGQPLSPPVLATHRADVEVWKLASPAGNGVIQIAENGNPGPLIAELTERRAAGELTDVRAGAAPLVPPGSPGATALGSGPCAAGCADRVTLRLYAPADDPRLSWVSMVVCTNDGFTGDSGIELPTTIGEETVIEARAYETSTEMNTENLADIMPPCQGLIGVLSPSGAPGIAESNPALAETGNIIPHRGVIGGVELDPAVHGWAEPVSKIIVTRVG